MQNGEIVTDTVASAATEDGTSSPLGALRVRADEAETMTEVRKRIRVAEEAEAAIAIEVSAPKKYQGPRASINVRTKNAEGQLFPGPFWIQTADGVNLEERPRETGENGLLSFELPVGEHTQRLRVALVNGKDTDPLTLYGWGHHGRWYLECPPPRVNTFRGNLSSGLHGDAFQAEDEDLTLGKVFGWPIGAAIHWFAESNNRRSGIGLAVVIILGLGTLSLAVFQGSPAIDRYRYLQYQAAIDMIENPTNYPADVLKEALPRYGETAQDRADFLKRAKQVPRPTQPLAFPAMGVTLVAFIMWVLYALFSIKDETDEGKAILGALYDEWKDSRVAATAAEGAATVLATSRGDIVKRKSKFLGKLQEEHGFLHFWVWDMILDHLAKPFISFFGEAIEKIAKQMFRKK